MEELVQAVNRIAASNSTIPLWLSLVGLIVPIVLTIVSICLSFRMDKQNKELQKLIANRDMVNQSRETVLGFYISYLSARDLLGRSCSNVADIFTSDQSYYNWSKEIDNACSSIIYSYNKAKLMLDDQELLSQMKKGFDAFAQLNANIKIYIGSGIPSQTIANAWTQFTQQYTVLAGDYYVLFQNRVLGEAFAKLCETSYTKDIQACATRFNAVIDCDDFDAPFKKYVQIKELD